MLVLLVFACCRRVWDRIAVLVITALRGKVVRHTENNRRKGRRQVSSQTEMWGYTTPLLSLHSWNPKIIPNNIFSTTVSWSSNLCDAATSQVSLFIRSNLRPAVDFTAYLFSLLFVDLQSLWASPSTYRRLRWRFVGDNKCGLSKPDNVWMRYDVLMPPPDKACNVFFIWSVAFSVLNVSVVISFCSEQTTCIAGVFWWE